MSIGFSKSFDTEFGPMKGGKDAANHSMEGVMRKHVLMLEKSGFPRNHFISCVERISLSIWLL